MKSLLVIAAMFFGISSFAQTASKEDSDIVKQIFGKSKKEIINDYMKLPADKQADFDKVYDAYEASRKQLANEKINLILDYADNYDKLTEEKADQLATASLKNILAYDNLNSEYYKKFKKVLGAIDAAKLMQMETYIQTAIRSTIQDHIPFIGELEKQVKK